MELLLLFLIIVVGVVVVIRLATRTRAGHIDAQHFAEPGPVSGGGMQELKRRAERMIADIQRGSPLKRIRRLREYMDRGLFGAPVSPEALGVDVNAADANGVPAEWVLAAGADPQARMLYIHGGGFVAGSPTSARMLTAALSSSCGVAVLSVDYRLMPEHKRMDSVVDCQNAYRYLLEHGPNAVRPPERVFVAGDSAGGNLALMLSAWVRDAGLRPIDGVIAFSPSTDATLSGVSTRQNIGTDPMLGPSLAILACLPAGLRTLGGWIALRGNPRNPIISPLFGDLSGLPPTLVQASTSEMLFDDARRYVDKAKRQGSPAELQTWSGMVHVFQMFAHLLPEAGQAIERVAQFVHNIGYIGGVDSADDKRAQERA